MEAEAQCAFLDDINLTDGTITDDSDIWLFGGKTVYKNFFNQHKNVMEFRAENIQHHFKLTREQMILLALLVGSDYTTGLQGIGPVTALEILAAFPPSKQTEIQLTHQQLISGLESFRRWLSGARAVGPGRTTLRNKLKNVVLTESFPSLQVVRAYLEPTIDPSKEPFSWAKPDIPGLMEFARQKFGWQRVKSEEILKPVLKRLNESRIQKTIKDYFQIKHKIDGGEAESKMSKRVKQAIKKIGKERGNSSEEDEETSKKQKPKRKRASKTTKKAKIESAENEKDISKIADEVTGLSSDEDIKILKQTRMQSKRKIEDIDKEVKNEIEQLQEQQQAKKPKSTIDLHKKDVIPQKEKDKLDALRSKMKAIEVFRKSKKGPGYMKKRKVVPRKTKEDAELSESSSD
ncbi:hypothetical protein ILUMI_24151 [Ignelater luminosus]|uniref:XPG-I domain-containing protein n=1 Tax=Ignelater luminosus TaxID=2038154 RepID=A0A8K0CB25_IGNLU|nr:hypothetical protein ILUMI_24151 [Ignelater luminosus]